MRIGIDASRYAHTEATGVEWYSWHIINGLIELGKKDELVLYSKDAVKISGVENRVLLARRLWTLSALSKEMKMNPPDVLFVPSHVLPLTLPTRSVITIHDVAFKYLRKSYSLFQYKYLNWSTKFAVERATKIIVPSGATKNDLVKFFHCQEEKIEVVHHGFEKPTVTQQEIDEVFKTSDVFKYFGLKKTSTYVLFVGRLESKKNLVNLIEAFARFSETHPEYELVLAGKRGLGFQQILQTVNKHKLAGKVVMPGYVTEQEKAALFKYCKFFAFPSLYEGFGLPLLEAFHYHKPVLTSHVSCLPEVGGEAVHYVDPYDPEMMAMGLEKLANDEAYCEKLVEAAKGRLKLFTWEAAAKKTYNILKNG